MYLLLKKAITLLHAYSLPHVRGKKNSKHNNKNEEYVFYNFFTHAFEYFLVLNKNAQHQSYTHRAKYVIKRVHASKYFYYRRYIARDYFNFFCHVSGVHSRIRVKDSRIYRKNIPAHACIFI